jgi:hypothetical protein
MPLNEMMFLGMIASSLTLATTPSIAAAMLRIVHRADFYD